VQKHPRTPRPAKLLLWLGVGYLATPFDIVPDWIPLLGQVDDLVVVPALALLALKLTPRDIRELCRAEARAQGDENL